MIKRTDYVVIRKVVTEDDQGTHTSYYVYLDRDGEVYISFVPNQDQTFHSEQKAKEHAKRIAELFNAEIL